MMIRKHLLASLITVLGFLSLMAQNPIPVFGFVTNANGGPQEEVSITVTAFFADSSFFQESVLTGVDGNYTVSVPNPDPNILGFIQVDMVDCNNNIETQFFTVVNGDPAEIEANFIYCANSQSDSCEVFIIVESNPGSNLYQLTVWSPPGIIAEYLWSTGETTQTIVPAESGTYCVTVTMPELECSASDCATINIDSSGFCYAYIVSTPNGDSTYNLEAVPAIGVAPFTYYWFMGDTTAVIENVGPGQYCVIVTDSTGCAYTACIFVNNVPFCEAYISIDPAGGLTAYGYGLPPVEYLWNTGDTTQSIYPVFEGLYCVTVTDANGCEAYACYDYWFQMDTCFVYVYGFMQDSSLFAVQALYSGFGQSVSYVWSTGETTEIIYPQDPFQTYCVTVTDETGCTTTGCYDPNNWCYAWLDLQYLDTVTAVITAITDPIFNWPGAPDPVYSWSNGDSTETITVHESGNYCVTVSLGAGCTTEACTYVDFESVSNECYGWVYAYPDSSGSQWYAEVYPSGWGTFSYLWNTGDTTSVIEITHPQAYACVTVTSSLGCETVACLDSLYNPCEPWIAIDYYADSVAVLTAYAWNDPAQNATYLWSNGETGSSITVFTEGTYCVTVTGSGCTGTACVYVYFQNVPYCGVWVTQYDTLAGTLFVANPWGVPPFQYQWDNGDTSQSIYVDFGTLEHCVTITDATGCQSSACSFTWDSCYAEIVLNFLPEPQLFLSSWDPITFVQWSTGAGDTMQWLDIDQPGTYCAYFETLNGCADSLCINVNSLIPNNGINIISGFVFGDTLSVYHGNVYAYQLNNGSGEPLIEAGSSLISQDGFYQIDGLTPGVYIVKADFGANSPLSELYIPTYHVNSVSWELANLILIPNWLPVTNDIYLIRQTGTHGGGVIGGVITDPQQIVAGEGEEQRNGGGLANVVVLLHDAGGHPIDFTRSLEDGSFRFPNLAFGTYRIKFDIPGIPSQEIWVTLTPNEPEKLQVNILVEGSVAVKDPEAEEIKLYPNPAATQIQMAVPGDNVPYDIQVVDMQGKIVYAGSARNYNSILSIDVSSYANGLYHINLVSNDRLFYGRFVKQD